jgi:hypothetical protein
MLPVLPPTVGRRARLSSGFSLVWVLVLLGGMAAVALALLPTIVAQARKTAQAEDVILSQLTEALQKSVLSTRTIPGANTWAQAVVQVSGLNLIAVRQVFPQFPSELTSRRIYLIDPRFQPNLGAGILPFSQPNGGLDPSVPTQVPNAFARIMIVSSTKRGLTLPFSSGVATQPVFDSLWDWTPSPSNPDPPVAAGFGAAWQGKASHLHVARLSVAETFSYLVFRSLSFSTDGGAPIAAPSTVARYLLQGTPLSLYAPSNGALVQRHVVQGDAHFDFRSPLAPIGYWSFDEAVTSIISTNLGTAGVLANAALSAGASVSNCTLVAPAYTGFSATNTALAVNGTTGFSDASQSLMNGLNEFSLACWVNPTSLPALSPAGLCGQQDVAVLGFAAGGDLIVATQRAGQAAIAYPYPMGEWHHVAVTGDGQALRIYVDGTLRAAGGQRLNRTDFGSSVHSFRIGGGGLFDGGGNYFQGSLDNVSLFDRALSAAQIARLMLNQGPSGL